jgi:hypothetical protein
MMITKKFKPVITRVKLNPEQAVLACCSVIARKGTKATVRRQMQQCTAWSCGRTGANSSAVSS